MDSSKRMTDVSAKKAVAELQINSVAETVSGLFSTLADAMPQIVWATDADGAHFYYNRRWYEYTGMTEADSMGFGFAIPLHPDDHERTLKRWRQAWEAGEDYDIEYRFRRFDGVYRWFVGRAMPIRDTQTGNVRMWVGTCTDIDDTRRAFDALQESQDQFTVALRAAHLGTWQYDFATQGMVVSEETRKIFGIDQDGIFTLDTFGDRIHPEYVEQVLANFERVVNRETDEFTARYPVIRPDGSVRHAQLLGRYYSGGNSGVARISGVIQDVTESQNTLDALQKSFSSLQDSQGKLSLALQTARLGTWEYDYTTQDFDFSPRTMELFGITEATVPFERWVALLHEEDREAIVVAAAAMIQQTPPYEADDAVIRVQYRTRRPDGTVRYLQVMGARLFDADGKAMRIAGVAQDITEERNTLDALRESAEALRESESRFRSVVSNAPIIVFALDKNGVFTFHDGAGLAAAGRQPGFSVGRTVWDVYAEFPELLEQTRRALAGETTSWRLTLRGVTYDTQATPILDEDGAIDGIIGVAFNVTEQDKAEKLLQESAERFRLATESAQLGVWEFGGPIDRLQEWFVDPTIMLPRVDGMFRQIFDFGANDTITTPDIVSRIHPVDLSRAEPLGEKHIAGEPYLDEYRIIRPSNNAVRWVRSTGRLYIDGETGRFVGTVQDITEAREAEESLRESESRFRNLADNISQLAWMTDETGWVFWYNQRWFDYTGTTLEEMQGWGWQKIQHPDHVQAVTEKFVDHVQRGVVWEDTFPIRGADGAYRWFLSRAIPLRDDAGKIVRWFGTNTDITDSRRAEEEVRRSEERFRSLITATAQIVWTTRANGAFRTEQPAWSAFTGQSPDEYKGAGWLESVHEDDRDDTAQQWQEAVATHSIFMSEHRLRRADGVYRYMSVRAVPVMETGGAVREWIGVHTDITERKEVEFALAEYATKQARVAETLQQSLLNHPPSRAFPGIVVATKYEPALDEAQVGGDFFDVFALVGGKIALIVGDVTGKGLKAAEHTGQIKYALRAFLRENADPADALFRVNRLLTDAQLLDLPIEGEENNAMAAATVAVLDTATGKLVVAGGGAEFPLLYRAKKGVCEEVNTSGLVIGAYAQSTYESSESLLESGDLLILTTDGITESRRGRREFFGNEGVASTVESIGRQTSEPEAVAVAIIEAARNYSTSGTFRDDVCLLAVRRD